MRKLARQATRWNMFKSVEHRTVDAINKQRIITRAYVVVLICMRSFKFFGTGSERNTLFSLISSTYKNERMNERKYKIFCEEAYV